MSAWKTWERRCARDLGGERNLEETRSGGTEDVVGHGLPLAVQCKHGRQPSVWKAVEEAREATDGSDRLALAAVCRSHGRGRPAEKVAVMPWRDMIELLERAGALEVDDDE